MDSRHTFWAFAIVVLVLGGVGMTFSYWARNRAADAEEERLRAIEMHRRAADEETRKLVMGRDALDPRSLREWFEHRFRAAWADLRSEPPSDEQVLDALAAFQKHMDAGPAVIAKELAKK